MHKLQEGSIAVLSAMQDARLKQLSSDLRSDLNSSCLTQLKELVSDLVQQLRDSMARQAPTHRQTQPSLALMLEPPASPLLNTADLLASSSSQEPSRRPTRQDVHKATPHDPSPTMPGVSMHREDEEARSPRPSRAQSVLTEIEAEFGLAGSRVSSVIAEEEAAATHMAESVAESVSDFQYSMDFQSSIHRSPLSGFRSPASGESTVGHLLCLSQPAEFIHVSAWSASVYWLLNDLQSIPNK